MPVWFDELGTNNKNPNYLVFLKDAIDFCKQKNIDFNMFNLYNGNYSLNVFNPTFIDLNEIGKFAIPYMQQAPTIDDIKILKAKLDELSLKIDGLTTRISSTETKLAQLQSTPQNVKEALKVILNCTNSP